MSEERKEEKKAISFKDDWLALSTKPGEEAHLKGTKCRDCGEYILGQRKFCPNCLSDNVEQVTLSSKGILANYTIVNVPPPGWKGPVPYPVGEVQLTEGVKVASMMVDTDIEKLSIKSIGQKMELVVEKVIEDEQGNDIMAFRWKPSKD